MPRINVTRAQFLADKQGKTFSDVVNDPDLPFQAVLDFFNTAECQRRMEESEIHHDRAPLAGVVRELECHPQVNQFLSGLHTRRSQRLRQAVGVLVRILMERRGWKKTGKKGSLGVRAPATADSPRHNSGGLAFWFIRAERYELLEGMPFETVRERRQRQQAKEAEHPVAQS